MDSQTGNSHGGSPLPDMPCGCRLEVADLTGSPLLRAKLYAMGIFPGTDMKICHSCERHGSVCVRVRQCSLVLGESLARSIFCRAIGENEVHNHHRRHHGNNAKGLMGWCKKTLVRARG